MYIISSYLASDLTKSLPTSPITLCPMRPLSITKSKVSDQSSGIAKASPWYHSTRSSTLRMASTQLEETSMAVLIRAPVQDGLILYFDPRKRRKTIRVEILQLWPAIY